MLLFHSQIVILSWVPINKETGIGWEVCIGKVVVETVVVEVAVVGIAYTAVNTGQTLVLSECSYSPFPWITIWKYNKKIAQFTFKISNLGTDASNTSFTVLDIVLWDVDLFFSAMQWSRANNLIEYRILVSQR